MNRGKIGDGGDESVLSFESQLGLVMVRELTKQHNRLEIKARWGRSGQ